MPERHGFDPEAVGVKNGPLTITADQGRRLERPETRSRLSPSRCPRDNRAAPAGMPSPQGRIVDVVPVGVGQQAPRDLLPARPERWRAGCASERGPIPTSSKTPAPPAWIKVALPWEPLASTAKWTECSTPFGITEVGIRHNATGVPWDRPSPIDARGPFRAGFSVRKSNA